MRFEIEKRVLTNNAGDFEWQCDRFVLEPRFDSEGAFLHVRDHYCSCGEVLDNQPRLTSVEQAERYIKEIFNMPANTNLRLPGKGRFGLRLVEVPMKIEGAWEMRPRLTLYDRKTGEIAKNLIKIEGTTSQVLFSDSDKAYNWLKEYYYRYATYIT